MSVTFSLGRRGDDGIVHVGCRVDHYRCERGCEDFATYRYCECVEAAQCACAECSIEVNVSNVNALAILERLGIECDAEYGIMGECDAADMIARAMLGNIGRDDSGAAAQEYRGAGGCRVIEGSVRPGYYADRLGSIAELAAYAAERGLLVAWG